MEMDVHVSVIDRVTFLGQPFDDTDDHMIEDQLQASSIRTYAEHDETLLYARPSLLSQSTTPGSLPSCVAVIDASISLFGRLFSRISDKDCLPMLQHLTDVIKKSKGPRQEALPDQRIDQSGHGTEALDRRRTIDSHG